MKRLPVLMIAILAAGFGLAACGAPLPLATTVVPTVAPLPTLAYPTAVASSTVKVEPSAIPTATTLPGKAVSFDRLSLVIPTGVAAGGSGTLVPEAKGDTVSPWDVAPEHIQFKLEGYALEGRFHQPQIYVYPAKAYGQMQERGSAAQSL